MWNVKLYSNTGLNTVNTLDNPSRLNNASYFEAPALEILQGEHLAQIRIAARRADVKNVDFCELTDTESGDVFYYYVDTFQMLSMDVCGLVLVPDAVLTIGAMVGGVQNLEFSDGVVTRHHVPKSSDTYGAYTEPDPMLIPSKPLAMDIDFRFNTLYPVEGAGGVENIIESTLDLWAMGDPDNVPATTYIDSDTNATVTVPKPIHVKQHTDVPMFFNASQGRGFYTKGTRYFDGSDARIQEGIERARGMGIEGGILASYVLPRPALIWTGVEKNNGGYDMLPGGYLEEQSSINYEYASPRNKRVLYGELNMIEIISVSSGVRMDFLPEEIRNGNDSSPTFCAVHDVRPNGRPYYRSKYYRGVDVTTLEGGQFLANAVAGSEWADFPLTYTGKSGATLDEIAYTTSRQIAKENHQAAMNAIQVNVKGEDHPFWSNVIGKTVAGGTGGAMLGGVPGAAIGAIGGFAYGIVAETFKDNKVRAENRAAEEAAIAQAAAQRQELARQYYAQAQAEFTAYMMGGIVAPEIHFPASDTLRDYIGNGICVVRYRPAQSDIAKLDKILEMYGYRNTCPITNDIFNNRSKFNYVMISGASITGDIPKWLREAAAMQLSNGVRIWHQLPDVGAYTDGSNT